MTTMGTESGDRVITAEVDKATRKVAKLRGDDGYPSISAASALGKNKSKL
jgi:ribonuclease HII